MDRKTQRLFLDERISMRGIVNSFIIYFEGKVIGQITVCRDEEIMYHIYKDFQRNGFATEALKEIMKIPLKKRKQPLLTIYRDNKASQRVAMKAGFHIHSSHDEWDEWRATRKT